MKVVNSIYIDPNKKYIEIEDGSFIEAQQLNFHIEMLFYLILSQYFKKIRIKFGGEFKDLRTHLFLIFGSRTGKGQLIKVIEEIGNNLGLIIKRASYLEQSALIGSLDNNIIESNTKSRLQPDNPKYRDPVIYGLLAKCDILIIPEAKKLVKGMNESDTEFILSTFQEALDYPGVINKQMKYSDFPINYESTVSIFATTYYIEEISKLLLNQGFFQRVPTYKEEYSLEQVKNLRYKIIEKFRNKNVNEDFKSLAKQYAKMISTLNNEEKILTFDDYAINELNKFNNFFFKRLEGISGQRLELLKSFSQTVIEMIVKVAGINCCTRGSSIINVQDVANSIPLFHAYSNVLLNQLVVDSNKKKDGDDKIIEKILEQHKRFVLEKNEFPSKIELTEYCKSIGLGYNKTQRFIGIMISQNYFFIDKKNHNKHTLVLNEGD